jgi:5-methylcytosine-specific restriction endonuclease McrA
MWTIEKPDISAVETFTTCVEGFRSRSKRDRLKGIRQHIENVEAELDQISANAEIHLIADELAVAGPLGAVTAEEMVELYDSHMARQKSRGRSIYDKLMDGAHFGQCPFCGHLPVSTLDHTVPKKRNASLTVTPINLIPCCKDCNHNKGTAFPVEASAQFLNPYYDDVTSDRWLYAEIIEASPPGAYFYVHAPDVWHEVMENRVKYHFQKLKLGKLYASQAGRQLQNIRRSLSDIFDGAGPEAVKEDLVGRSASCADVSTNSWESALYEAAAESDWYCSGGFRD